VVLKGWRTNDGYGCRSASFISGVLALKATQVGRDEPRVIPTGILIKAVIPLPAERGALRLAIGQNLDGMHLCEVVPDYPRNRHPPWGGDANQSIFKAHKISHVPMVSRLSGPQRQDARTWC
jgi:hypothetical protein